MPINKAEQALASLDQMGPPALGAEGKRAAAETLADDPMSQRVAPKEAKFAMPEAAATAIAAGFILGPVGGLLMGAAQGILGKKEQQNLLDQQAAANEAMISFDKEISGGFDQRRSTATNDDDLQQIDGYQAQYNAARDLMASPYEETKAQGNQLMQSVLSDVRAYDVRQETQRVAQEAAEQVAIASMGKENWERYKHIQTEYDDETKPYRESLDSGTNALALLERGTPLGDMQAIKTIERMFNSGTVLLSEASTYRSTGGFWDRWEQLKQFAEDGTLDKVARAELQSIVRDFTKQVNTSQARVADDYIERGRDAGIDDKYLDNFKVYDRPAHMLTDDELMQ